MPLIPSWSEILARYQAPTRLRTRARDADFTVVATAQNLRITPESSGRQRNLTQTDFETELQAITNIYVKYLNKVKER